MIKRFRLIAGPNGSGKSTVKAWLENEYSVNFYTFLNADEIFAEVEKTGVFRSPCSLNERTLKSYAEITSYGEEVKRFFREDKIWVEDDYIHFAATAVNSYTVALVTNYLQEMCLYSGVSFSQETVFSHPSKVESLKLAQKNGFRTYLYFVGTNAPLINRSRVKNRSAQGGHDDPEDKIAERYERSLKNLEPALDYANRAFFFDNSGEVMDYLGSYSDDEGFVLARELECLPKWFTRSISIFREELR